MTKFTNGYYGVAFACSLLVLIALALLSTPFPGLLAGMTGWLDGFTPTTAGRLIYMLLSLILMAIMWFSVSNVSNFDARLWVGRAAGTFAIIHIFLDILTVSIKAVWVTNWIKASAGIVERFIFVANKEHLSGATLDALGGMFVLWQLFAFALLIRRMTQP